MSPQATRAAVSWLGSRHVLQRSQLVLVNSADGAISGSHKERAARAVVAAASADGYRAVTAGSCGNYALAIAVAAAAARLRAVVVVPAGWSQLGTSPRRWGAEVIQVAGNYEDAVSASHALARRGSVADCNVDGPYAAHVLRALALLVDEVAGQLDQPPEVIWVPLGNGTTITAIGTAIQARGWPTRLVGVTSWGNNSIAASWPSRRHLAIIAHGLRPTSVNEPLVNWRALHGQPAMDAIHASRGTVLALNDAQLCGTAHLGWPLDGASPSAAAGVAGYALSGYRLAAMAGVHLAVLTDRAHRQTPPD